DGAGGGRDEIPKLYDAVAAANDHEACAGTVTRCGTIVDDRCPERKVSGRLEFQHLRLLIAEIAEGPQRISIPASGHNLAGRPNAEIVRVAPNTGVVLAGPGGYLRGSRSPKPDFAIFLTNGERRAFLDE